MPKLGMEPIRRKALVTATIAEIGAQGSMDVTVGAIAKRAGMSSALAHHYFGGKDQIFVAAMRHTLRAYGDDVRAALHSARTPEDRIAAIVRASFSSTNFAPEIIAAWLNFYVFAQRVPDAARLLRIYQERMRANLRHALKPLVGERACDVADRIAALIDGIYLRQSLVKAKADARGATEQVMALLRTEMGQTSL